MKEKYRNIDRIGILWHYNSKRKNEKQCYSKSVTRNESVTELHEWIAHGRLLDMIRTSGQLLVTYKDKGITLYFELL